MAKHKSGKLRCPATALILLLPNSNDGKNQVFFYPFVCNEMIKSCRTYILVRTSRAVIDIDDIDVSMQMSCIDIENDISIHIDIVK